MIEDKIAKLLALAERDTTNPHEAANAAAMAAELAARHNVDLENLRNLGQATTTKKFVEVRGVSKVLARDLQGFGMLMVSVSRLYGCYPVFMSYPGETTREYVISGQEHNAKLAVKWIEYLWTACKRANTEHARAQNYGSSKARDNARSAFRFSFCGQVAMRLTEKWRDLTKPVAERGPRQPGTALVVGDWLKQEEEEVRKWTHDKSSMGMKPLKTREVKNVSSAVQDGARAGREVSLNEQLEGGSSASPRLR